MLVSIQAGSRPLVDIYIPGPQGPKGDKGDTGTAAVDVAQTWTKAHRFEPDANFTPLTIKSNVAQTADLFAWTNNANAVLGRVTSTGWIYAPTINAGAAANDGSVALFSQPTAATQKALILRGAVSQSANLVEIQTNAGAMLVRVDAAGLLYEGNNRVFSAGNNNLDTVNAAPLVYGGAGAAGSSVIYSHRDHVHPLGAAVTSLATSGNLSVNASTGAVTLALSPTPTFTSVAAPLVSVASTTNLGAGAANSWTKVATVSLPSQYSDAQASVLFLQRGDGLATESFADLIFRVKQQSAFLSDPFVDITMVNSKNLAPSNFAGIIVSNAGPTVVELWMKVPQGYQQYDIYPRQSVSSGTITWQSNQGYVATLPAGTVIAATPDTQKTIGIGDPIGSTILTLRARNTYDVVGIFQGSAGQTADLTRWMNSAGTIVASVNSSGQFFEGANRVYSAGNTPPYPVTSVAGRTGAIVLSSADVSNVMDLSTAQTAAGIKVFTGRPSFRADPAASMDYTTAQLEVYSSGTGKPARLTFHIGGVTAQQIGSDDTGIRTFSQNGLDFANFRAASIFDNGNRVYSASNANLATTVAGSLTHGLAAVLGTGTLFARNDHHHGTPPAQTIGVTGAGITATATGVNYTLANTGVTSIVAGANVTISGATGAVTINSAGPTNMVTLDTAQTITGQKILSTSAVGTVNSIVRAILSQTADLTQWQDSAGAVLSRVASNGQIFEGANRVYSAGNPPPATDLSNYVTLNSAQTISAIKTFTAAPVVPDASFAVAKLSATGVRDATTFLRGDNTWAAINISNMMTTDTAQTITGQKILSTSAVGTVNSIVRAITSQTADLVQWQSSASAVLSRVGVSGGIGALADPGGIYAIRAGNINGRSARFDGGVSIGADSGTSQSFFVNANVASSVVSTFRAAAAQTADIMQFQDSAGNVLARVANDGTIYKGNQIVGGNAGDTEILGFMGAY